MIKNPKYLPNKKNNHNPPEITDERVKWVPVGCGNCMECRKQKKREWQIRFMGSLSAFLSSDKIGFRI